RHEKGNQLRCLVFSSPSWEAARDALTPRETLDIGGKSGPPPPEKGRWRGIALGVRALRGQFLVHRRQRPGRVAFERGKSRYGGRLRNLVGGFACGNAFLNEVNEPRKVIAEREQVGAGTLQRHPHLRMAEDVSRICA